MNLHNSIILINAIELINMNYEYNCNQDNLINVENFEYEQGITLLKRNYQLLNKRMRNKLKDRIVSLEGTDSLQEQKTSINYCVHKQ